VAPPGGEGAVGAEGAGLAPKATSKERVTSWDDMMHQAKELYTIKTEVKNL
jgi:hypothetical protein